MTMMITTAMAAMTSATPATPGDAPP